MNFKNKKILVTGGSGFIGVNLISELINSGAKVKNFDLSEGFDIENKKQLEKFIKKKFDVIYHLAGFSGSTHSNRQKLRCFQINTFSLVNLLELIVQYSPSTKLIISSSRLEYGKPRYLPVDENHPTEPTSIYGLSKLAATQLSVVYHKKNNLDVTIFRTSNVYGPHHKTKFLGYNVVNYFIDQALRDKTLTIYGDGEQARDYIYIDDLIEAFILAFFKKSSGQIYNLGYGEGIQFKEMTQLIIKNVGRGNLKYIKWPKQFEDVETGSYISDITKIRSDLGFKPKVSFAEGIGKTLEKIQ